jgi:hypothetical protein
MPLVIEGDQNSDWPKVQSLDVDLRGSRSAWRDRLRKMDPEEFRGYAVTPTGQKLAETYAWFIDTVSLIGRERGIVPTLPPAATVDDVPLAKTLTSAAQLRADGAPPVLADWTSPGIAFKNRSTGDGRALAGDITWAAPPLPLMAQLDDAHGSMPTMQSQMAGGITTLEWQGDSLAATGVLDDTDTGRATAEALSTGRFGVSIDLAVEEFEVVLSGMDDEGGLLLVADASAAEDAGLAGEDDTVLPFRVEDELFVVTKGVVRGATVVPFPAWADAGITITASGEEDAPTWVRPLHPQTLVITRRAKGTRLANDTSTVATVSTDGTLHYQGRTLQ